MSQNIFEFEDYKAYLNQALEPFGKGSRLKLAKAVSCQAGYITHVLGGSAHFSLEQADKVNEFLGHSPNQGHFFILLVSFGRAGTESLKKYFKNQIENSRNNQNILKNRILNQKTLSQADQAIFYSSWYYAAIQVAVSIPGCQTENGLSEYFQIPISKVNEIVSFLLQTNLIVRQGNKLTIGSPQVFLGSDSPNISKLHTNWRIEAIKSLERYTEKDLHYSAVITASFQDVAIIRELMVKTIEQIRSRVRDSKDEACFVYNLDLFRLGERKP